MLSCNSSYVMFYSVVHPLSTRCAVGVICQMLKKCFKLSEYEKYTTFIDK